MRDDKTKDTTKDTVMSRVLLGGRVPTPNSLLLTTYYLLLITYYSQLLFLKNNFTF